MARAKLEMNVEGLGVVYEVSAPWDQSLEALRSQGIRDPVMSSRDLAYARRVQGRKSSLNNESSVKECAIYVPNGNVLLVRASPLLTTKNAQLVTQAHRNGNEFYLDATKYQEQAKADAKKDPQKRRILTLDKNKSFDIPTEKFGEYEVPLFMFQDQAIEYGEYLREHGINEMSVWLVSSDYVNKQDKSFARQLWLGSFGGRSGLDGLSRGLGYDCGSRGVLKGTSVAGSQTLKLKLLYTQKDVDRASKIVTGVRSGDMPTSKLEEVSDLIEKLRQ